MIGLKRKLKLSFEIIKIMMLLFENFGDTMKV